MLTEYDEWVCDYCAEVTDEAEMVFRDCGEELCDSCYEEEQP